MNPGEFNLCSLVGEFCVIKTRAQQQLRLRLARAALSGTRDVVPCSTRLLRAAEDSPDCH